MNTISYQEQIPVKGRYDVIVAGGGVAGIGAALAARRRGASVLLAEKTITLGGLATIGLVNLFVPMCNGRGKQVITGLAEELLRFSIRDGYGDPPKEWQEGEPKEPTTVRYATRFSPQIFAMAAAKLLRGEGVELLLDAVVSAPVMEGTRCKGLILETKGGRGFYEGGVIIDVTGDADILHRAGVPTADGQNYFTYYCHGITLDTCRGAAEKKDIAKAIKWFSGGPANLYGGNQPEGRRLYKGTTAEEITEYVLDNQELVLEELKKTDRKSRDVMTLPTMPQFRTTRRILGDYTLTMEDVYRHFEDSVGAICDFDHRDRLFEVPYRCLVKSGYDNLITAGRTAGGEGYAWDVLRVIPPAILTGQAAGTAAVLALSLGCPIAEVPIDRLQEQLAADGVTIHFPDEWIPEVEDASYAPGEGHI